MYEKQLLNVRLRLQIQFASEYQFSLINTGLWFPFSVETTLSRVRLLDYRRIDICLRGMQVITETLQFLSNRKAYTLSALPFYLTQYGMEHGVHLITYFK